MASTYYVANIFVKYSKSDVRIWNSTHDETFKLSKPNFNPSRHTTPFKWLWLVTTCLLPLPGKPFGEQDGKIYFGHIVINILADVDCHTFISKVENLSISKVVVPHVFKL